MITPFSNVNSKIGNQYDVLGYKESFCSTKLYLSYSKETGWTVKPLKWYEQIFRNIFGCYKSTHIEHVTRHLKKMSKDDVPIGLSIRIDEIWRNTFGKPSGLIKTSPKGKLSLFGYEKDVCNLAIRQKNKTIRDGLLALDAQQFKYHSIPGDGHCLFRSIAAGIVLSLSQAQPETLIEMQTRVNEALETFPASDDLKTYYGHFCTYTSALFDPSNPAALEDILRSERASNRIVKFLRLLACEYIENDDQIKNFLGLENPDEYLKDMKSMSKARMGGNVELDTLVEILGLDVTLLDVDGIGKGGNINQPHYKHTAKGSTTVALNLLYYDLHYNLAVR